MCGVRYQYAYFQLENIKPNQTKVLVAQSVLVCSNKLHCKFHYSCKNHGTYCYQIEKAQLSSVQVGRENDQSHTFFEVVD